MEKLTYTQEKDVPYQNGHSFRKLEDSPMGDDFLQVVNTDEFGLIVSLGIGHYFTQYNLRNAEFYKKFDGMTYSRK